MTAAQRERDPAADRSPFAIRGVIEGFYGNPWTHAQRLDCIRFIGARGMNTFVYAPKDDPLLRRDWRLPYDAAGLARLRELVAASDEAGVTLSYAIAPGWTISYADPADVDALVAKLRSVGELGVRRFTLLLDDIPSQLQHEADRVAYRDLVDAHAALITTVASRLDPGASLEVCPFLYRGRGDEPYITRLGESIDPAIDLYWTGRAVCSPTLDLEDAERFTRAVRRPPLYWDNYPVNDVAMGWELHIGPYRNRDRRLHESSRGVVANPMELYEASKIPLATIADFLLDPSGYDADASYAAAIRDVAGDGSADGGEDAAAFALFADNVRSSCLNDYDAPVVARALTEFAFHEARGDGVAAAVDLAALAASLLGAADHLLRGPVANPALIDDCRPWIEAFELGAQAMARVADLAADGRLERDARSELLPWLARLRARRVRVLGDALDMFLADTTVTYTRPGRLLPVEGGIP
jgi:hyaluronoglucosaminidase